MLRIPLPCLVSGMPWRMPLVGALLVIASSTPAVAQHRGNLRALQEYGAMMAMNEVCRERGKADQAALIETFLASKIDLMAHMLESGRVVGEHNAELRRVLDTTRKRRIDKVSYEMMRDTGQRLFPDVLSDACKGIANQVSVGIEMDEVARTVFDAQVVPREETTAATGPAGSVPR